ncbi:GyrI-like domain-containing protein [Leifsonia sp. H3M29-4]|uniref:GyrI-like domain-containing protein n=1 Tax=Salinibacterium metalliresistens TaxID=3031321 RepID=UPI0023DAB5D6|nr:GyrI-like domain-containing protein [Salinibacterium metalliresistens]MDF1477770.1 GyrI-like domain-containing protein [Salinibacterium metalliresistens]
MEKTDFKKTLDSYQARHHEFRIIDVPPMQYLMIDGHGDPSSAPEFSAAIEALYPVAYALKFASRNRLGRDYVVPPLEGLWWSPDMSTFTSARNKSRWNWTLMLMVPEWITREMFDAAATLKADPMAVNPVRLESLDEGRCVQTLHIGSFDDETSILATMHEEFIPKAGLGMAGKHHEIYFSDFRKVAPAKLRTILRQPVTTG